MRSLSVSPFVAGEPVWLGPEVTTLSELVTALEVLSLERPGLLQLVPGIALIHSLTGADGRVALHWVHLPHEPRLIPGEAPKLVRESGKSIGAVARELDLTETALRISLPSRCR